VALEDIFGAALTVIGEEHLFTSFLSSPATIRNMYVNRNMDVQGIRDDLNIALALELVLTGLMAFALGSWVVAVVGASFGLVLYGIYKYRAGL
jgi:hypothetical protein